MMKGNKKNTFSILLIFMMVADEQSLLSAKLAYNNNPNDISSGGPGMAVNKIYDRLLDGNGENIHSNNHQLPSEIIKSLLPIINNTTPKRWHKLDFQLFRLLSLTDVPKISTATKTKLSSHYLYMLNVYNLIQDGPVTAKRVGDFFFQQHHHELMDSSHRIVSFKNFMSSPRYPNKYMKIWFNVSEVHIDGVVDFAELKIYKNPQVYQRFLGQNDVLNIRLYSCPLLSLKINGNNNTTPSSMIHFKSINVSANFQGWLSINITNNVRTWLKNSSLNCGIVIKSFYSSLMKFVQVEEEIHLHPFLVAYFRNSADKYRHPKQRRKVERAKRDTRSDNNENCCNTKSMMIDFQELGYDEFILHPMEYDAKHCSGSCLFPSSYDAHYLPHTILQSLMHHNHPEIPEPVCSPSELGTISVLYFDINKVILHHLPNMTIEACACY